MTPCELCQGLCKGHKLPDTEFTRDGMVWNGKNLTDEEVKEIYEKGKQQ